MSSTGEPVSSAIYEFTVAGILGPTLRHALEPVTASMTLQTVMRAHAPEQQDLVDVVFLLQSLGLEITDVSVVD